MFHLLGNYLITVSEHLSWLRLVNYLTFRGGMIALTAFIKTLL